MGKLFSVQLNLYENLFQPRAPFFVLLFFQIVLEMEVSVNHKKGFSWQHRNSSWIEMRNLFYFVSHDTTRPKNLTQDAGCIVTANMQHFKGGSYYK